MNKHLLLTIFCLLQFAFCNLLQAQNLVPNPSFEEYTTCPDGEDEIYYATGWSTYLNTPDYFNSCFVGNITSGNYSVPTNGNGHQLPPNPNCKAYAGLYNYNAWAITGQELIGRSLYTTMTIGQKYFLEMKVSLANSSCLASNNLGFLFSTKPYNANNPAPVNNFAHYNYPYIIADTANWTKIFGSFIADSAYQYIIIGNFFDLNHTDTIGIQGGYNCLTSVAYYYIDDVCVSTDSSYCYNYSYSCGDGITNYEEKIIGISPNPVNSVLHISAENIQYYNLKVYNATGELVLQSGKLNSNTDIDLSQYPEGIYFIQINSNNKMFNKKFIIEK